MSKEILQIVENMNKSDIEIRLALQCAPLLTNLKISNIIIVDNIEIDYIIKTFKETPISIYILYKEDKKTIILLYKKYKLLSYFTSKDITKAMHMLGYKSMKLKFILREFSKRYTNYMVTKNNFPHEMGFILGYPFEDVKGYIENNGQNFLYAGYWKVYSNLKETISIFEEYNWAKEQTIKMISQGRSIKDILNIYHIDSLIV